ncbi:hypothetical protein MJN54_34330, partial [Salmonella enterica subsp. enterica serovar Kentucky]|nr:hypothetical protein [Salmonella enterica subsp. enterica serovar Kentucky]
GIKALTAYLGEDESAWTEWDSCELMLASQPQDAIPVLIDQGDKQLAEDPFNNWVALNKKGAIVTGKVTAVDAKGATVELADGVE